MIVLYALVGLIAIIACIGSIYLVGRLVIYYFDSHASSGDKWSDMEPGDRPPVIIVGILASVVLIVLVWVTSTLGELLMNQIPQ